MDDLSEKLQQLLSSPDTMDRIQSMMTALGSDTSAPEIAPPPPSNEPDMGALLKLAPLLGQVGQQDDGSNLLRALRPYMHDDRSKRLDDAIRMLQLMKLIPLLKGLGG